MSYELMIEYDKVATVHFQEKKRYGSLKNKVNKEDNLNQKLIQECKNKIKYHEEQFKKYDLLAYKEMKDFNIGALYFDQVTKKNNRALRCVRYFHYREWNKASLCIKERWGIELLKESLRNAKNPVVSCSFGIDSIVTLYITRKALRELNRNPNEIQVIWNDTLNEFPDVKIYANDLVKEWNLNLLVTKPKKTLKKVIDDHGGMDSSYFARKGLRGNGTPLSEKCCGVLKHEPMKRVIKENNWDLVINGLRADESTQRLRAGLRDGEYFYSNTEWKSFVCRPIMWMKEEDIWDYVEQENIPYNSLYDKNMLKTYPENHIDILNTYENELKKIDINIDEFRDQQLLHFTRKQSMFLSKIGYDLYTPRTGCMQCPIPIKYGYLQWMRNTYPKIFKGMIYTLGYGKVLLELIPEDVKEEIKCVTGIDLTEENAHEYLDDILAAKPCTFDKL